MGKLLSACPAFRDGPVPAEKDGCWESLFVVRGGSRGRAPYPCRARRQSPAGCAQTEPAAGHLRQWSEVRKCPALCRRRLLPYATTSAPEPTWIRQCTD